MISHVKRMNSFNPAAEYLVLFNNPSFNGNHKEVARTIMTTLTVGNNAPNNVILFAKDYVTYEIFMSNTFYNDADCRKFFNVLCFCLCFIFINILHLHYSPNVI